MNEMTLSIDNEIFNHVKQDIDMMLERTVSNMTMRGADESVITIKLGISLDKKLITTYDGTHEITQPSFKHDISSVMQIKDKMSGQFKGNVELTFDENGRPVIRDIDDGQLNIWDDNGKANIDEGNIIDVEVESLKPPERIALPEQTNAEEDDGYGYDDPEEK